MAVRGWRLRGFIKIMVGRLPAFCFVATAVLEFVLAVGVLRDDIAVPPRVLLGLSFFFILSLVVLYLLLCGWLHLKWLRSIGWAAPTGAPPEANFPWPSVPQVPGQPSSARFWFAGLLMFQAIVCSDQVFWAVRGFQTMSSRPPGAIRSFLAGIVVFRVGVALAAMGALTALPLVWSRRLWSALGARRALITLASTLVAAGLTLVIVGGKYQLQHPVPPWVHMAVMHPWGRAPGGLRRK